MASSYPFGSVGVRTAPADELVEQPAGPKPYFLQLRLGDLKAGIMAKPEEVRIELRCGGLKAFSLPAGDPCLLEQKGFMSFKGVKVLLPLPPEFSEKFAGGGQLPPVHLLVKLAAAKDAAQPMSFNDVLKLSGRAVQKHVPETSVLHATLLLDNLDFDDPTHLRPLALCSVAEAPHESVLAQLKDTALPAHVPSLAVAACLRDDLQQIDGEQSGRVYVGDVGALSVEEVLQYPQSQADFRRSLAAGSSALSRDLQNLLDSFARPCLLPLVPPCEGPCATSMTFPGWDEKRIGLEGTPLRGPVSEFRGDLSNHAK